jgi:cell division septal protein FtsQ
MPRKKKKASLKERRQAWAYALIIGAVLLFIVIIGGIAYAVRLPDVTLSSIEISGENFTTASDIEKVVRDQLAGSYLFLIPRQSGIFYPKSDIERALKESFVPINQVSIHRDSFTTLSVSLQERVPVARWCISSALDSPCYLMDEAGLLFTRSDTNVQNLFTYEGGDFQVGDTFLEGNLPSLREFIDKLPLATKRTPEKITVDTNNDVFVHFVDGGELRFVFGTDPGLLLENITSVFSSKRFATNEALEYVDFRFGNKVYVKFVDN